MPEKVHYQHSTLNARAVVGVVFAAAVVIVLVTVISNILLRRESPSDPASVEPLPRPQPQLSSNPDAEIETYRDEKSARLHSYGWIDRNQSVAHLPIDRAMQILATPQAKP